MKPSTIASAAALLLAGLFPTAHAGHLNTVLEAHLDGRSEVGGDDSNRRIAGDPNGRGEAYVFGIDGDPTTLCYVLTVSKIQLTETVADMKAHIHRGEEGVNGPVVANLAGPFDGNAADCLTEFEAGKFPGDPPGIVQEILNNPEQFYINVHNPKYPGGAIRGQLESVADHKH